SIFKLIKFYWHSEKKNNSAQPHNMTDQTLNYTCTICMSLLYEPIQLSCKHLFCMWCMDRWKEQQNFCPLCKTKIDDEQKLEPIMNIHQEIEKLFPEQFKL